MFGNWFFAESIAHGTYDPATDPNFVAVWESTSGVAATAGVVSSWTDRVASIVASGATGHQPSLVANQINTSLPVLRFDNTLAYQTLTPPAGNILASGGFFISVVIRPTAAGLSSYGGIMGLTFPAVPQSSAVCFFASSPAGGGSYGAGPFWGGNPESTVGNGGWPITNGAYGLSSFTYNTSSFDVWNLGYSGGGLDVSTNFSFTQNGTPITIILPANALSDPGLNQIGAGINPAAQTLNGDIAAIYLAKLPPTGGALTNFQNYISTKWGV